MKKYISAFLVLILVLGLSACGSANNETEITEKSSENSLANIIVLNGNQATLNGTEIKEYDYTWSFDPSMSEPEYSGEEPGEDSCYVAHDIIYYPEIPTDSFVKENYDGEMEWSDLC